MDPAEIIIHCRIAVGNDSENLLRVRRESVLTSGRGIYPEDVLQSWAPVVDEDSIREQRLLLDDPDRITLIALIQEKIAGLTTLGISEALVKQCYVLPEFQGKGIAALLMRKIEEIALENGIKTLKLSSSLIALPFYEKNGYKKLNEYEYTLFNNLKMKCFMMEKIIV